MKKWAWTSLGLALVVASLSGAAAAAEKASANAAWLAAVTKEASDKATAEAPMRSPAPASGWKKPAPLNAFTFSIEYTLVTDYIWRGLNFSEYPGEGREKLNHQMSVTVEFDPSELGTPYIGSFGFNAWFEWYADQDVLNALNGAPGDNSHNQENDYTAWWTFDLSKLNSKIPLTFETGVVWYTFPRLSGDAYCTHEWYVTLSLDDGALLGLDGPILSPSVTMYWDLDDVQAQMIMINLSHEFALKDHGCAGVPVLKDTTVTPSVTFAIDHRFYDKAGVGSANSVGTQMGYIEWGLAMGFDLSSIFGIPEELGSLSATAFMNYTNSCHDSAPGVQDEFWGGMTVGWSW